MFVFTRTNRQCSDHYRKKKSYKRKIEGELTNRLKRHVTQQPLAILPNVVVEAVPANAPNVVDAPANAADDQQNAS